MLTESAPAGHSANLIVAHTSDLHLGARTKPDAELAMLRAVIGASQEAGAALLIMAGDIFDNNRVAQTVVDEAARVLGSAAIEIVVLPGNHDPATPDSVYRRSALAALPNLHIIGVSGRGPIQFPRLDLEVWGAPHEDYADMQPLAAPGPRSMRWQVVVAHGHWVSGDHDLHRGWLIHGRELAALGVDYVALGHWELPQRVGDGAVEAYYSGSPEIAGTINVVSLAERVDVRRHPLLTTRIESE